MHKLTGYITYINLSPFRKNVKVTGNTPNRLYIYQINYLEILCFCLKNACKQIVSKTTRTKTEISVVEPLFS